MGNVNDMGVTVKRVGRDEPPRVAVIFPGWRPGFALFGTIPSCRDRLTEALRQLTHMEFGFDVDSRVTELEAERRESHAAQRDADNEGDK